MYTHTKESQDLLSPADAVQILKDGNKRFCANLKANRNLLQQVNETRDGQWPFAAILSCIDSRTSAELIFDQGLGDIFSIRIAGNFVNEDILGSLEFACGVAGAKLVVVLGHSECGAIKGACDRVELGHLTQLLAKIAPAVNHCAEQHNHVDCNANNSGFVQSVAEENVKRAVSGIPAQSVILSNLKSEGKIDVIGAMYDVASGEVNFL